MFQYLRDVCSTKLLSTPVELGGPGVIVQIDESLFNHKSKYKRYVRRFGHLWLAQCHPKPSLADVSVWLPFSSLPSAITATYWTCCKTETAR
jgi:hypothetical protein